MVTRYSYDGLDGLKYEMYKTLSRRFPTVDFNLREDIARDREIVESLG